MTAYHAVVGTGNVKSGETILIVGAGGLGFNALQVAQSIGARVIVSDKRQEVLDTAAEFGVPREDIIPLGQSVPDFVQQNDIAIDTVLDFVGLPETFEASQEAGMVVICCVCNRTDISFSHPVRLGGKLVQIGLLAPELTIKNLKSVRKHLSILCSYGGTMKDLQECLGLISQGKLHPQVVTGSLDDLPQVLDDLHHGKIKSRIALIPNL